MIDDAISIGTVAAFVIYVGQIYQPLTQLTNARVDVMTALVSFERVFEVLDFPPLDHRPARRGRPRRRPQGRVEFDHVWFRHPLARGRVDRLARGGQRADATTSRARGSSAT